MHRVRGSFFRYWEFVSLGSVGCPVRDLIASDIKPSSFQILAVRMGNPEVRLRTEKLQLR